MKKTVQFVALAASLLLPAGGASMAAAASREREVLVTAIVGSKHPARPRVVVEDVVWTCTGNACTARIRDDPATRQRACYRLARMMGGVTSFDGPAGAMPAEELDRCNRRK
ncbi:hypothetical protein GRI75_01385 [Altererythrobacter soli]|uniref:UrcA family protein n=1 Tax=Croceibacterium soli TaxID=1739690 RepID=A0A6I4UPE4_9SPHN|nr:hypothetical protein [Croceibacterium soli]MXP40296.1 hypothetical protein [Croceibacterium soli]